MDTARFRFLFRRYVEQSCTEEEKSELFRMIESSDHDETLRAMMDSQWQTVTYETLPGEKADQIFESIMRSAPDQKAINPSSKKFSSNSLVLWRMAAALAFVIVSGLFAFYFLETGSATAGQIAVAQPDEVSQEHMFIKLPDGSTVLLNSGSTLDYPPSFSDSREVTLTGEGYFDIVHDPSKPFIVHTGSLKTTVLGTAFNIRAYAEDDDITVTVTRGKVKVSDEEREIGIILPDEQITFDGKNRKAEKRSVDSQKAIAWAENDIYFNELTMAEAVRQLEERFDIKIAFAKEELKECRFTATFLHNESIDQILEVICEFNNASFVKKSEGTIVISGDGC